MKQHFDAFPSIITLNGVVNGSNTCGSLILLSPAIVPGSNYSESLLEMLAAKKLFQVDGQ